MFGKIKMKRTTSMTGIAVDDHLKEPPQRDQGGNWNGSINGQDQFINGYGPMLLSPRYATSDHHVGLLQPERTVVADFLRTCGLCQRRLVPGRDIYMYRGDTAFCSQECREEQMKQDEKKEKRRKLATQHHDHLLPATAPATGTTTEDHYVAATLHY